MTLGERGVNRVLVFIVRVGRHFGVGGGVVIRSVWLALVIPRSAGVGNRGGGLGSWSVGGPP